MLYLLDYRRLHHHDERNLRGAADSDSEKKLRVGAILPARYRLYLRNVHRPQYGAYTVNGFRKHPDGSPIQQASCMVRPPAPLSPRLPQICLWTGPIHKKTEIRILKTE